MAITQVMSECELKLPQSTPGQSGFNNQHKYHHFILPLIAADAFGTGNRGEGPEGHRSTGTGRLVPVNWYRPNDL